MGKREWDEGYRCGFADASLGPGLTKREWFAGVVAGGMTAYPGNFSELYNRYGADEIAVFAVKCADALIAELAKEAK